MRLSVKPVPVNLIASRSDPYVSAGHTSVYFISFNVSNVVIVWSFLVLPNWNIRCFLSHVLI